MRYRSKPSEVEAVQWDGAKPTADDMADARMPIRVLWVGDHYQLELRAGKDGAQGWVPVPLGHWCVRQPSDLSDHWPVEDTYFRAKYEPATGGEQ